jgi:NAD(P)-dependent dehydrogenase (short-subunit alcohol dehydrogenase family)
MGSRLATRRRSQEVPISTRTALVGGGASGIGYAVAECLARAGHRVVITGRRPDVLASVAASYVNGTVLTVDGGRTETT